jgi:hypothetical protein
MKREEELIEVIIDTTSQILSSGLEDLNEEKLNNIAYYLIKALEQIKKPNLSD